MDPEDAVSKLLHRFSCALDWMWDLPDGVALAFRLWLKFTVDIVQKQRGIESRRLAVSETNRLLQYVIARTNVYIRGRRQGTIYIDAAAAARRRIRRVIKTTPCRKEKKYSKNLLCIHGSTAVTLETLQKHAYQEIKSNILMAVGKRLPREIADLVIEQAFSVEGVPMDPRVLCYNDGNGFGEADLRPEYKCPSGCIYLGLA
jgi:hypothetical protein